MRGSSRCRAFSSASRMSARSEEIPSMTSLDLRDDLTAQSRGFEILLMAYVRRADLVFVDAQGRT